VTRSEFLSLVNGVAIGGIISGPLIYDSFSRNRERFEVDATRQMREAVGIISESEYENYETDFGDVTKYLDAETGTARMNIGVEAGKTNSQNLKDQLVQGEYLDEAAEIFGVYAKNMLETEGLRHLELGFENGIVEDPVWYEGGVDDIDSQVNTVEELGEFYRDTVGANMRIG
jgi:hypothetical protein